MHLPFHIFGYQEIMFGGVTKTPMVFGLFVKHAVDAETQQK